MGIHSARREKKPSRIARMSEAVGWLVGAMSREGGTSRYLPEGDEHSSRAPDAYAFTPLEILSFFTKIRANHLIVERIVKLRVSILAKP